jgi:hypothetical protein
MSKMKDKENIPKNLKKAGRKLPFQVPDSYFENLPGRIEERLQHQPYPDSIPERKGLLRSIRPVLAAAAVFIGLLAAGYLGFRLLTGRPDPGMLSEEVLIETLEYFAYDIDNEMLASAFLESDISLSSTSDENLNDEIIQYLSQEDIDFSRIMYE